MIYRGRWAVWSRNWPWCGPAERHGRLWRASGVDATAGLGADALVRVLADREEPMRAREIHAAVETMLGEAVAWSSVRGALASNVSGSSPRFVRVARGRYVLASR